MLRPNPFLVCSTSDAFGPLRVFSSVTRRAFSFDVGWDHLIAAASTDTALEERLVHEHVLTRAATYVAAVEELLERRASIADRTLNVTFTVTTQCPMRCPYCFEANMPRGHASLGAISAFHEVLRRTLERDGRFRSAYLVIMGGEPLLCPTETETLLSGFVEACAAAGTPATTIMTLNGSVAPEALLDRLSRAGLQSVQVTFDGNRPVHEVIRRGSYDAILRNLPNITSRFSTAIKYNVSKASSTPGVLEDFLDDLAALPLNPTSYLIEFEALKRSPSGAEEATLYHSLRDPGLARTMLRLTRVCVDRFLPASLGPALRAPCVGTTNNALMIETDGTVRSCVIAYGEDRFLVGRIDDLESLVFPKDAATRAILEVASRHCFAKDCPFLPMCQTGCLLDRWTLDGSDQRHCRFDYFDAFFPGLTDLMLARRDADREGGRRFPTRPDWTEIGA